MKLLRVNSKRLTRLTATVIAAALALPLALTPAQAYSADAEDIATYEQQISDFKYTYPQDRSFEAINQYFVDHPYDTSLPDKYDIEPDIANDELNALVGSDSSLLYNQEIRDKLAGRLSEETLTNALNATNFMRYHAGLQEMYIHTGDAIGGRQGRAQLGAALLAELGQITHYPSWADSSAAGVSSGVFGWAKAGPAGSNCVAGYGIATKMVETFMPDIGNDRTGLSHRSYVLNPAIAGTGFGAANLSGTTNKNTGKPRGSAVLMFVTYGNPDPYNINAVMWPSQRQPIETFRARGTWTLAYPKDNPYQGNPWSFFFNIGSVDTSTLKVTLECDGKSTEVMELSKLTETEKANNRLFTINSAPLKKLIAWRPYNVYTSGDKVHVTIEGIVDEKNLPIPVEYDVHFFETGTTPHPNLEQTYTSRTAADTAEFQFTSDYEGTLHYLVLDADQAAPTADEVLAGTEITLGTNSTTLDLTALTGNGTKKLYYITTSTTGTGKDYATANKSGEMSEVKSIDIEEFLAPSMVLTSLAAARASRSTGTVSFVSPVAGAYYYVVRDASELICDHTDALAGTEAVMAAGENRIDLTGLTDNDAKSVFIYALGEDGTVSAVTRIELPAYQPLAPTVTPPTANTLTYNGTAQTLITAGSANGGTIEYRLGDTGAYSTTLPTATDAGDYIVWYKVVSDDTYDGAAEQSISVSIAKAKVTATAKSYAIQTGDNAPDLTSPVAGEHYTVEGLFGSDALDGTAVLTYEKDGTAVTPDTSKAGTYDIVLSGLTEPANGNYEPITLKSGTLTISARPSSGGSGGSYTAPTYPVSSMSASNGSVSCSTSSAAKGSTVTITVKPESGYRLASLTVRDSNGNVIAVTKQADDRYTFVMPNGKVSVEPVFERITASLISFVDVKSGDYYFDAVQWAVEKGITEGTSATTFSPDMSCTRAQMVTFLWRAAGSPAPKSMVNPFTDVTASDYYYNAVLWAVENSITTGVSADRFAPGATVSRAQTVTFLYRAAGSPASGSSSFSDVSASDYYAAAVAWAVQNGITTGTGNGKFSPEQDCTRAQIVTLLYRADR